MEYDENGNIKERCLDCNNLRSMFGEFFCIESECKFEQIQQKEIEGE